MRFVVSCLVTVLCLGTTAAFAAAPEPTTDEQKTLYALGLPIGDAGLNEFKFRLAQGEVPERLVDG